MKFRVNWEFVPGSVNPDVCDWWIEYRNFGFWYRVPYLPGARAANTAEAEYFGNRQLESFRRSRDLDNGKRSRRY